MALTKSPIQQINESLNEFKTQKGQALDALAKLKGEGFDKTQYPDLEECVK